jgi:hypothetical protein
MTERKLLKCEHLNNTNFLSFLNYRPGGRDKFDPILDPHVRMIMNCTVENSLQLLAATRFHGNEYAFMNQGIARRLSHIFMATENNRQQSTVLLGPHEVSSVRDSDSQIENWRD